MLRQMNLPRARNKPIKAKAWSLLPTSYIVKIQANKPCTPDEMYDKATQRSSNRALTIEHRRLRTAWTPRRRALW
jgi:hypothetical protein